MVAPIATSGPASGSRKPAFPLAKRTQSNSSSASSMTTVARAPAVSDTSAPPRASLNPRSLAGFHLVVVSRVALLRFYPRATSNVSDTQRQRAPHKPRCSSLPSACGLGRCSLGPVSNFGITVGCAPPSSSMTSCVSVTSRFDPSRIRRCVPELATLVTGPGTASTGRPISAARAATSSDPDR